MKNPASLFFFALTAEEDCPRTTGSRSLFRVFLAGGRTAHAALAVGLLAFAGGGTALAVLAKTFALILSGLAAGTGAVFAVFAVLFLTLAAGAGAFAIRTILLFSLADTGALSAVFFARGIGLGGGEGEGDEGENEERGESLEHDEVPFLVGFVVHT